MTGAAEHWLLESVQRAVADQPCRWRVIPATDAVRPWMLGEPIDQALPAQVEAARFELRCAAETPGGAPVVVARRVAFKASVPSPGWDRSTAAARPVPDRQVHHGLSAQRRRGCRDRVALTAATWGCADPRFCRTTRFGSVACGRRRVCKRRRVPLRRVRPLANADAPRRGVAVPHGCRRPARPRSPGERAERSVLGRRSLCRARPSRRISPRHDRRRPLQTSADTESRARRARAARARRRRARAVSSSAPGPRVTTPRRTTIPPSGCDAKARCSPAWARPSDAAALRSRGHWRELTVVTEDLGTETLERYVAALAPCGQRPSLEVVVEFGVASRRRWPPTIAASSRRSQVLEHPHHAGSAAGLIDLTSRSPSRLMRGRRARARAATRPQGHVPAPPRSHQMTSTRSAPCSTCWRRARSRRAPRTPSICSCVRRRC